MQFTAINTLAFVDVPQPQMGGANMLFSLVQQVTFGLGIAAGAVALRLADAVATPEAASLGLVDFRLAFLVIGALGLVGLYDSLLLSHDAGALVSKHRAAARPERPCALDAAGRQAISRRQIRRWRADLAICPAPEGAFHERHQPRSLL